MKEPVLPPLPSPAITATGKFGAATVTISIDQPSFTAEQLRAYALEAVKAERERLLELAKSKGWGMKNDDPFEDWLTDLIGELDRAAIRSQEG